MEAHSSANQTAPSAVFSSYNIHAQGGSGRLPITFWIHVRRSWQGYQIADDASDVIHCNV